MQNYIKLLFVHILSISCMAQAHQLDIEYSKDFTDLIELVYGSELLSQGGTDLIDLMRSLRLPWTY